MNMKSYLSLSEQRKLWEFSTSPDNIQSTPIFHSLQKRRSSLQEERVKPSMAILPLGHLVPVDSGNAGGCVNDNRSGSLCIAYNTHMSRQVSPYSTLNPFTTVKHEIMVISNARVVFDQDFSAYFVNETSAPE